MNNTETMDLFEQAVGEFCNSIIEYERPSYQSQLQPFTAYAARMRSDITQSLHTYYNSFRAGYQLVLDQIANKKSGEEKDKYLIPGKRENTIQSPDDFSDLIDQKEVLQAVFQYSGQMMSEVYELGVRLRQDKKQEESRAIFIFLITLNPYVCSFWQGLGKTYHEQQLYDEALNAYCVSINCDPFQIGSYRDAIRCCLDNKNYKDALVVLNHGLEVVSASENDLKDFKKNIEAMMAYVHTMEREKV